MKEFLNFFSSATLSDINNLLKMVIIRESRSLFDILNQSKFLLGAFVSGNTLDNICNLCNFRVVAYMSLSFWYLIIHKI